MLGLMPLIFGVFPTNTPEKIKYDIYHKGKPIGMLTATKQVDGDRTVYLNTTYIKASLVATVEVSFTIKSSYKGKSLDASTVDILLNGKPYTSTSTKRVGSSYQFSKDGKLQKTISGDIGYSAARMMFDEPKGFLHAYSEEKGVFDNIEKVKQGTYQKSNSRGRKSVYDYQAAVLKSIDMDLGITEIEMVLKD
jgi:hypothetical protein